MRSTIGILALQGDFAKHLKILRLLNVETALVKKRENLQCCNGLIIPGGESTTLTKLMKAYDLSGAIREFAERFPIMGTCAGAIMVANRVDDERVEPLRLIEISVLRNAYGRQKDSFVTNVYAPFLGQPEEYRAIFIRAPIIQHIGSQVEILLELQGKPIMVRQKNILALTFHPELSDDARIHEYFLEQFLPTYNAARTPICG